MLLAGLEFRELSNCRRGNLTFAVATFAFAVATFDPGLVFEYIMGQGWGCYFYI